MRKILLPILVASFQLLSWPTDRLEWESMYRLPELNESVIDSSIEQLRAYLLNAQNIRGDFNYELRLSDGEVQKRQNQLEQVSALYAMSGLMHLRGTEPTRRCLIGAFDFFNRSCRPAGPGVNLVVALPEIEIVKTETVSQYGLALADFLEHEGEKLPESIKLRYSDVMEEQLRYLQAVKLESGWGAEYDLSSDYLLPTNSPIGDIIALQYYCRLANCFGHEELRPVIEQEILRQIKEYVIDGTAPGADLSIFRSYFGDMAEMLDEYLKGTGATNRAAAMNVLSGMAWWMIYRDSRAISEAASGRIAWGLLLARNQLLKCRQDGDAAIVDARLRELVREILRRQVGGVGWHQEAGEKVSDVCVGGVLSRRDSKNIRLGDCVLLLQLLLNI